MSSMAAEEAAAKEGLRHRFTGSGESVKHDEAKNTMNSVQKDVKLQQIRDKAQKLRAELLDQLDGQLSDLLDDFVQEVEQIEQPNLSNGNSPAHMKKRGGGLPEKEFLTRRSVLTELLEISHIRTIYHIFVAILIIFTLNTVFHDLIDTGRLNLDFELISWAFGKFPIVVSLWLCMTIATILVVYPVFNYWANNRKSGPPNGQDYCWLALYSAYQITFIVWPLKVLIDNGMPPASKVIITCEQVRLLMKSHAFIRENIPKAFKFNKNKAEDNVVESPCPDFSKYLYFLFAPTLVYRDSYPRTANISWQYVASNFAQVFACLFYTYFIFVRFLMPAFSSFNGDHLTPRKMVVSWFNCMMPGTLVLFIAFFAVLHSWFNAFAEMLTFGDRLFYRDWWNSSNFAGYYRTWNGVVHDWLFTYIYKDALSLFKVDNKPAAMASVFLLSAIVHEYIIIVGMGFFYPVLFVMFGGAGFGFMFLPKRSRIGNIFMWCALFMGMGLLMCLYSMEWYARLNCKAHPNPILDHVIPRSWFCISTHANA